MFAAVVAFELRLLCRTAELRATLLVTLLACAGSAAIVWRLLDPESWRGIVLTSATAPGFAGLAVLAPIVGALVLAQAVIAREWQDGSYELLISRPPSTVVLVGSKLAAASLAAMVLSVVPYAFHYGLVWRWGVGPLEVAPLAVRWLLCAAPAVLMMTAVGGLAGAVNPSRSALFIVPVVVFGLLALGLALLSWWIDASVWFLLDLPALDYWPADGVSLAMTPSSMTTLSGLVEPLLRARVLHLAMAVGIGCLAMLYYCRCDRDLRPIVISPTSQVGSLLALYRDVRGAVRPAPHPARGVLAVAVVAAIVAVAAVHSIARDAGRFERRVEALEVALTRPVEVSILSVEQLDADVAFDPSTLALTGGVTLVFENTSSRPADGVVLALNAGLDLHALTVDGAAHSYLRAAERVDVCFEPPLLPGDGASVRLEYAGVLDPLSLVYGYVRPGRLVPLQEWVLMHIRRAGWSTYFRARPTAAQRDLVSLEGAHLWLPMIEGSRLVRRASVRVELPRGLTAVAPGLRFEDTATDPTRTATRFIALAPVTAVDVYAARYVVQRGVAAGIPYEIFHLPQHGRQLAEVVTHIEAWLTAVEHLALSESLGTVTAVETPTTSVSELGGGSLVVVDERALYAERWRPSQSRWEGLGEALVRRLMPTDVRGDGARNLDWGLRLLLSWRLSPTPESAELARDATLTTSRRQGFVAFSMAKSDSGGVAKAQTVLRALALLIGNEAFDRGLGDFLRDARGRPVEFADFEAAMQRASPGHEWFFDDYFHTKALPELAVVDPAVTAVAGGYSVHAILRNLGTGRAQVALQVETDFDRHPLDLFVESGGDAVVEVVVPHPPRAIIIDPERHCLRLRRSAKHNRVELAVPSGPALRPGG